MSQIERLQERRIAAADQFLGRCLIVNELSNRPLDQVDQPKSQPTLTYQIFLWVFWASLLLSQLSAIDLFLAGPLPNFLI